MGLLVVALAVGAVLFARSRKRSPWTGRAGAALDESDEITTHLVGLAPGGVVTVASADATRLAALAATIEQLMSSAPDDASRQALASLQEPLRSLHASVDAIALAPAPPSTLDVEHLRSAATTLHQATSLARASLVPPSSPTPAP